MKILITTWEDKINTKDAASLARRLENANKTEFFRLIDGRIEGDEFEEYYDEVATIDEAFTIAENIAEDCPRLTIIDSPYQSDAGTVLFYHTDVCVYDPEFDEYYQIDDASDPNYGLFSNVYTK